MKRLLYVVISLSIIGFQAYAAPASFPLSDPTNDCRTATRLFGLAAFNACINKEQLYHDVAKDDWLNVSDNNRSYCINLMNKSMNSSGFYWGFETCLNGRMRAQAAETPAEFHR